VLARIKVPTLVVHGADDRIVKLSAAQHMARIVPGARLLVYERTVGAWPAVTAGRALFSSSPQARPCWNACAVAAARVEAMCSTT
jgi:pimeloyl-ACP methyl ester carboxylesterase